MARRKFNHQSITRVISLTIQDVNIQQYFPKFAYHYARGDAVWRGPLQPSSTSPRYIVEIRYKLKELPKVWVLSPALAHDAVHLYRDKNLCLYWPKEWKWEPNQLIAKTIIPWTASWLYFYELWLDTGKWLGPSSHDYFPPRE